MPVGTFVNPEIIMGYKSPDFSGLDPARMMSNVLAYKQAKTQQQVNALALQQKQQEAADQALLQEAANQSDPVNYLRGLGRLDIANTYAGLQQEQEGKKLDLENAKRKAANEQFLALAPQRYAELQNVSTPEEYMKWHLANPELYGTNKAARTAQIQEALAQEGGLQKQISGSKSALETILGIKPAETKQFQPTAFESEFALYKQDPAAYRRFKEAQKVETGSGAKTTETVDDTGITKAERNKREAAYPKAKLSFTNASSDIDTLISDLNTLKSHKGLSGITGLVYGRTPGITGDARAAEALLEKILSRGQFRSLQELRNNSPTGGAVGNVSDFEGRALRSSFGALDRKQDTPDFQNAIDDVIDQLKSSKQNLTGAFEDTYSYRSGSTPSAPAAESKVQLSPQDQAALDWANKNPKDPRAAQIKAKLGVNNGI